MLIDTSGWFCILDERDSRRESAISLYDLSSSKVTHSYIIAELVALCDKRRFRRTRILDFLSELFDDPEVTIVWVDEKLSKTAFDLLQSRLDKSWSLCDAVSFVIMEDAGINESLTTDHHFKQAGFIQLLDS